MGLKFGGTIVTRTYRDATNETSSMQVYADSILPDGSNYAAVIADATAMLDAMELFQHDDVVKVSETVSQTTFEATGATIPTTAEVQREKVVILTFADINGNTFQRGVPMVDFDKVTLGSGVGDFISPSDPAFSAVLAACSGATLEGSYGLQLSTLLKANVGGRNN